MTNDIPAMPVSKTLDGSAFPGVDEYETYAQVDGDEYWFKIHRDTFWEVYVNATF